MKLLYFVLFLILVSCSDKVKKPQISSKNILYDTLTSHQDNTTRSKSASISENADSMNSVKMDKVEVEGGYRKFHFDFDDFSNEGGEGYAYYNIHSKKIEKADITLFGEREKTNIHFTFLNELINVREITYLYKTSLSEIKSDNDMTKQKPIIYTIDFNGTSMGKADENRVDIFQEFKKTVPFELK